MPGYASGDGCNCLIDTLRQQLKIFANINLVREVLEQKFQDGPAKVKPGDYLELEYHWKDVVNLLWRFNQCDLPVVLNSGRCRCDDCKIVCVDMN